MNVSCLPLTLSVPVAEAVTLSKKIEKSIVIGSVLDPETVRPDINAAESPNSKLLPTDGKFTVVDCRFLAPATAARIPGVVRSTKADAVTSLTTTYIITSTITNTSTGVGSVFD